MPLPAPNRVSFTQKACVSLIQRIQELLGHVSDKSQPPVTWQLSPRELGLTAILHAWGHLMNQIRPHPPRGHYQWTPAC